MSLGATTSAPASTWLDGRAGEQLERLVVLDLAVAQHAAVTVARVLAEAHVGDERQAGHLCPQRPQRPLHDPVRPPRRRSLPRPSPPGSRTGSRRARRAPRARPPRARSRRPSAGRSRRARSTGRTTPSPGQAKSGITTSSSDSRVSRTSARSVSVRRSRRSRVTGKPLIGARVRQLGAAVATPRARCRPRRHAVVVPGSKRTPLGEELPDRARGGHRRQREQHARRCRTARRLRAGRR